MPFGDLIPQDMQAIKDANMAYWRDHDFIKSYKGYSMDGFLHGGGGLDAWGTLSRRHSGFLVCSIW